ncbi:MAG: A/G-specific adenine glycosylase [Zetaproteobacteria bacterium]|nr:MAG: A/G-specific adenine glycosylase [Zetaproteobacteria bacterium]
MTGLSSAPCEILPAWYKEQARDLPWRRTCDPYAVWISEIMLQQTQVSTVIPHYLRWLKRFPDVHTLSRASEDAVLKAWQGLGYYRRARWLHKAARRIIEQHGGLFPTSLEDIQALPGIGRSTAGAIASICFGIPAPVLDGNVRRVLQRWTGRNTMTERELWPLAQKHVDGADDPGTWNQAMMELGATVCTPRMPKCDSCPVCDFCASKNRDPSLTAGSRKSPRPRMDLHWRIHLHLDANRGLWLIRRSEHSIWSGLWSPPISEMGQAPDTRPDHVHLLTHRRLLLYAHFESTPPDERTEGAWVHTTSRHALPTGIVQLLRRCRLLDADGQLITIAGASS